MKLVWRSAEAGNWTQPCAGVQREDAPALAPHAHALRLRTLRGQIRSATYYVPAELVADKLLDLAIEQNKVCLR